MSQAQDIVFLGWIAVLLIFGLLYTWSIIEKLDARVKALEKERE